MFTRKQAMLSERSQDMSKPPAASSEFSKAPMEWSRQRIFFKMGRNFNGQRPLYPFHLQGLLASHPFWPYFVRSLHSFFRISEKSFFAWQPPEFQSLLQNFSDVRGQSLVLQRAP